MATLVRLGKSPNTDDLSQDEIRFIDSHFEVTPQAVMLNGVTFTWDQVTEVETAKAARSNSPAGWFVKKIVYAGERYHVAVYAGRAEAVLPNTTYRIVQHIVQTIAYYAPKKLKYSGVEGVSPISEE